MWKAGHWHLPFLLPSQKSDPLRYSVFLGLYLLTLECQFIWLYSEMCQKQLLGLNAPNGFKHPLRKWSKKNSYTSFPFLTGNLFSIGKEHKCEIKFSSLRHAVFFCPGLFCAPVAFTDYIYRARVILNTQYIWEINLMACKQPIAVSGKLTQYISNL